MPQVRTRAGWLVVAMVVFAAACTADPTTVAAPDADVTDRAVETPDDAADPADVATAEPDETAIDDDAPDDDAAVDGDTAVGERTEGSGGSPTALWVTDIAPEPRRPADWTVPFPLDPGTVEFELENGLGVILRRNLAPGGQAQLRLVVDAGSLEEEPTHLGSAHFLEHMMFNGTERYPGNALVPVLEEFGAGFGPDVNAYTSYSETVYQLTVPTPSHDVVDEGLLVLAEWASRATIASDAVEAERGVVREEFRRSAERASGRLGEQIRSVLFADSRHLGRDPIGELANIEAMQSDGLRRFYETWYRPDLMTVIVVGDIDIAATESSIRNRFADLPAATPGDPQPVIDDAAGGLPEPVFDVLLDPELAQTELEVLWRMDAPPVLTPDDLHRDLVASLAMTILDLRMFAATERGASAASSSSARISSLTDHLEMITMQGDVEPDRVLDLVTEFATQAEQMRQYEVSPDELDRARERLRRSIDQEFAESARIQDSRLAAAYVAHALGIGAVPEPRVERDAAFEVLDSITVRDLRAHMHEGLDSPPYVLLTAPSAVGSELPAPETIAERWFSTAGRVVPPPVETEAAPDQLLTPPPPATEIDRAFIEPLNTTVVTYANGARVAVRPSRIVNDLVEFQAWSRGGFFHEDEATAPLLGRASSLVLASGFESIDTVALDQVLGGSVVSLTADVGRATETVSGEAASLDLETFFQLLHLQMTEPTISDVAIDRFDDSWRPLASDPEVRPTLAADLELWRLRYGDSPYFRLFPTLDDLDALDGAVQLDAWNRRFGNAGDFVFVFVGDVDLDALFALASRYIGTLPADESREGQVDRDPGVPEQNLVSTVAVGVGEQGRLRINWESPYPFTIEAEVAAQALELVVDARLRDLVREQLGASYAPSAEVTLLSEPKAWVDTIIELDGDPARLDEVSKVIRDELARLRQGDVDPGYLDRAVDQLVLDFRFFSNPQWLDLITFHLANPDRPPDEYQRRAGIAESLTVEDLAETARSVFPETRSVEVRLVPAG